MLATVLILRVLGRWPSVLCTSLRLLKLLLLPLLYVCEELISEALKFELVDFAHADSKDSEHRSVVGVERLSSVVVLNTDLIAICPPIVRGRDREIVLHLAFMQREQDSVSVARCALLLRRVVNFLVLVVFERGQEVDLVLVEAPEELIAALVLDQLVGAAQCVDVVASGVVLRILAPHVAPEIHVAKDELVVLLRAPEGVMDTWNGRRGLILIEEVGHSLIAITCVSKSLLRFLLPRREMAVHKHEAAVIEVEAQSAGTLICSHSFNSCFDFHCFEGAESRLVEGVAASEKHDIAAKHHFLRNASVRKLVLSSVVQCLPYQRLPLFHAFHIF